MKHVRCRDLYATPGCWRASSRHSAVRFVAKVVLLRGLSPDRHYLRGMVRGARASFKFPSTVATRLYVDRG